MSWKIKRSRRAKTTTPPGLASGQPGPTKTAKGLNLVLSALPINSRLVLREYTPEDEKKDEDKKVAKFRKK